MSFHGFVLDLDRCTGCAACVIACTNENSPTPGIAWRSVATFNDKRFPIAPVFHYSLACNHCLDPSCMEACPAAAYTRDPSTGAVLVHRDRCIGCRYCTWVCPYDAPRFNASEGVIEKCTFCQHRLSEELEPACVTACPVEALAFESNVSPSIVVREGFPETGLRPAIRVVGDRRRSPPEMTAATGSRPLPEKHRSLSWREFRGEWSLWAFSSIITLLVAWFAAATASGSSVSPLAFASAGALALAASTCHLGRPTRAWRGILNWRRSWISREAVLVAGFLAVAGAFTVSGLRSPTLGWGAAIIGFAAVFAMDMVYRVPGQTVPAVPHSAMATLTAAYYLGLVSAAPAVALPAAALKLILYLGRRDRFAPAGTALAVVRVVGGLVIPCTLLPLGALSPSMLVAFATIGELIDRGEFYAGLEFLTPELQIARDFSLRS